MVDDLAAQDAWLRAYRERDGEAYFIIERAGEPVGTVRLSNAQADSFEWGSWIIRPGEPPLVALESMAMVHALAWSWGFRRSHFSVRRANRSVWRHHERHGSVRVGEDDEQFHYRLEEDAMRALVRRHAHLIPFDHNPFATYVPGDPDAVQTQ